MFNKRLSFKSIHFSNLNQDLPKFLFGLLWIHPLKSSLTVSFPLDDWQHIDVKISFPYLASRSYSFLEDLVNPGLSFAPEAGSTADPLQT